MAKEIMFGEESRKALLRGVDKFAAIQLRLH